MSKQFAFNVVWIVKQPICQRPHIYVYKSQMPLAGFRHPIVSRLLLILLVIVTSPLPLAAVSCLVQDAPLLSLAVPAGAARAAAAPRLPAGGVAQDAVVVDEEVGMPVAVVLVPAVGPVVADELVFATAGEPVEVTLAVLVLFGVVAFVKVVVEEVDGQAALGDDALLLRWRRILIVRAKEAARHEMC